MILTRKYYMNYKLKLHILCMILYTNINIASNTKKIKISDEIATLKLSYTINDNKFQVIYDFKLFTKTIIKFMSFYPKLNTARYIFSHNSTRIDIITTINTNGPSKKNKNSSYTKDTK